MPLVGNPYQNSPVHRTAKPRYFRFSNGDPVDGYIHGALEELPGQYPVIDAHGGVLEELPGQCRILSAHDQLSLRVCP